MRSSVPTAFFYGRAPLPTELLAHYGRLVVEPDALGSPPAGYPTEIFAYVSIGEVSRERAWYRRIPRRLLVGVNPGWKSDVVDVGNPEWASFLAKNVVAPLYARGFRAFFLDTVDSYQLISRTDADRARHERGLVNLITGLQQRWPDVKILLNRGFEILPRVSHVVSGVIAESLFEAWDAAQQSYVVVSDSDRAWLVSRLEHARDELGLPVCVIDYVPSSKPGRRREVAKQILDLGFDPWVSSPELDEIGVGVFEIVSRRILVPYRSEEGENLGVHDASVVLAPVLEHLGYVPEYVDIRRGLPSRMVSGQYAGVVAVVDTVDDPAAYQSWILGAIKRGLRVVFFGDFGFTPSDAFLGALGLEHGPVDALLPFRVSNPSPYIDFETKVRPRTRMSMQRSVRARSDQVRSLLRLEDARQQSWDAAVVAPWGGYAFHPYLLENSLDAVRRWQIDPFLFLRDALALPLIPAPDVTTESGNRILTVHLDGDGFASRTEAPSNPFAGQVILDDILRRYDLPHTVSVIEGEIGPDGSSAKDTPALEAIARRIFALPNVEVASHTYSHPFEWAIAEAGTREGEATPPHLPIKGYRFDLSREIDGSIAYINERLAPKDKPVRVFLWSGDCSPSPAAVARVTSLGVLNVNGGGATRTFDLPSLTKGSPLGIPSGENYQVYAPVQNENVYTNHWRGPFYGWRDVKQTFALNESPRRLSPLSIYYHFFAATKSEGLKTLRDVYQYALAQQTTPLKLSEYAARVLSFQRVVLARRIDDGAWRIANFGELHSVRLDASLGFPDFARSSGVAGAAQGPGGNYVHLLEGGIVTLRLQKLLSTSPHLVRANGTIRGFDGFGRALRVQGQVPLEITLGGLGSNHCTLRSTTVNAVGTPVSGGLMFRMAARDTGEAHVDCQ